MGSKNLKAIVARGKERLRLAEGDLAKKVVQWFKDNYDRDSDGMHLYGTPGGIPSLDLDGILPSYNFRDGSFEYANAISGQTMARTIMTDRGTCYACTVACKREVEVPERGVLPKYGGMEYETIAANGSLCGVGDLAVIAEASQLANQYVLDSISVGVTIAFAMECYEHGILTKVDTGGLDLSWGNGDALIAMIHRIGRREGLGNLLAEGTMRAAAKLGRGAEKFALHVKGQELPMHEPRGKRSLALAYALSPTGADHMEAIHDPSFESFGDFPHNFTKLGLLESVDRMDLGPKKVRTFYIMQTLWGLYNSIGMCDFVGAPIGALDVDKLREYVNAATGWDMSLYEMMQVGERSNTMARFFNMREGLDSTTDTLPDRMFEPLRNGALEGKALDRDEFKRAIQLYYQMAGWNEQGLPTPGKLAELGLTWLIEDQKVAA
jgi:aldehyde:ferredoxin oxidoreductase